MKKPTYLYLKRIINRYFFALCLLMIHTNLSSQNLVSNPDFELYSSCPTSISQVDRASGWNVAVITPDYYNCDFTEISGHPSTSLAYSGTGFIGFLSSNAPEGKAECVGQNLVQPLSPDSIYIMNIAAKKTSGGDYTENCGGVAIYGFEGEHPVFTDYAHISTDTNAILIGKTDVIDGIEWEIQTVNLALPTEINSIALTIERVPNCRQYIFIDDVYLYNNVTISNDEVETTPKDLKIYPNPSRGHFMISNAEIIKKVEIYDAIGRLVFEAFPETKEMNIKLDEIGYYMVVVQGKKYNSIGKMVITR